MEQPTDFQDTRQFRRQPLQVGRVTGVLIGICIVTAFFTRLGDNREALGHLFITENDFDRSLPEVVHGQVWRLLTPMFIHFGIMHLVFNMIWLKDLGTAIERLLGPRRLLELVVAVAALSNVGQFLFDGPYFGGMSGVVYGLFGFVWMQSRFDPGSGFFISKQTVTVMVGWFVLCLTHLLGPVANYAHGVGLAVGMLWGFAAAKRRV